MCPAHTWGQPNICLVLPETEKKVLVVVPELAQSLIQLQDSPCSSSSNGVSRRQSLLSRAPHRTRPRPCEADVVATLQQVPQM